MSNNKAYPFALLIAFLAVGQLSISTSILAQSVGNCPDPTAHSFLDNGFTRAKVLLGSRQFYDGQNPFYELPKGSAINPIFMGVLWFGGIMDGELRVSAARYEGTELWPGPLNDQGQSLNDCINYDHVYKVSKDDLDTYESTGNTSVDLSRWPTGLGAPTYDRNRNLIDLSSVPLAERIDRSIDLAAGERPAILGHQSIWWIMNDAGNDHEITQSHPLGIEVHGLGYSVVSGYDAIDYATLFNYRVFNRTDVPITDAYIGFFFDVNLGDFDDDLFGSDSSRGMGFIYNWDNDDGGPNGYGSPPPALGALFLEGPLATPDGLDNDRDGEIDEQGERLLTTTIGRHRNGGGSTETPTEAAHFYNYMRARWKDGVPFTVGMRDHTDDPTNYFFPGDPVTRQFWSEVNDFSCTVPCNPPGDRNMFISSGPFELAPGSETDATIAIVWAKGQTNFDSITELRAASDAVQLAYDTGYFIDAPSFFDVQSDESRPSQTASLSHNFPEPFTDQTQISYRISDFVRVRLTVYDVLGREIEILVDESKESGKYSEVFDGSELPTGVYFYRIQIGHASATRSMMLVK